MTAPADTTPFDFVDEDHFRAHHRREEALALFRRSVKMLEIEIFSYCNRRCWFCPNSYIDRHSTTEYMAESLYLGMLDQLAEVQYSGMISYSRYNEPLADRIVLDRLAQAQARIPNARLHTNTNGDYLTPRYLAELSEAGLRSLNIQIYLANQERYEHERMRAKLASVVDALGLDLADVRDVPGVWLEVAGRHLSMDVRVYARNFEVNGCNRGESVPIPVSARRTSPCLSPFYHLYIDYNGEVMPCCNLRSDNPAHGEAVVANLHQTPDLFLVYASEALAAWRRSLVGFGPKQGLCAACSFVTFDATPAQQRVQHHLAELAQTFAVARVA